MKTQKNESGAGLAGMPTRRLLSRRRALAARLGGAEQVLAGSLTGHTRPGGAARPLFPREAEFGVPPWVFGQSTYAFLSADTPVCAYREGGRDHLARLDSTPGRLGLRLAGNF